VHVRIDETRQEHLSRKVVLNGVFSGQLERAAATASAQGCCGFTVYTFALVKTRSAEASLSDWEGVPQAWSANIAATAIRPLFLENELTQHLPSLTYFVSPVARQNPLS
jgi:hypothetical protein